MNWIYLLPLIIFVIAAIIIFKVAKTVMKALFLAASLFCLILLIMTLLFVVEVRDFKEKFNTEPNLYLLEYPQDKISAGVSARIEDESFNSLNKERLKNLTEKLKEDNIAAIRNDNYKVLIINEDFYEKIDNIEFLDTTIKKEEFFNLINSNNALDDFSNSHAPSGVKEEYKNNLMQEFEIENDADFKNLLFMISFTDKIENDRLYLINGLRKKEIEIYPKSMVSDAIINGPFGLMQKVFSGD